MSLAYVIKIIVTAGEPDGVRVVEKSNWTGRGVVFSRSDLPAAAKQGLDSPGVYVLLGDDPDEAFDEQIYVGQGEDVGKRLAFHQRDDTREFWTDTVVFVSASGSLNRAHILHLESRLVGLAHDARRARVGNGNRPAMPSMTAADEAEAEGFLAEMLGIFPVLGVGAFDKPAPTNPDERRYFLTSRGANGEGVERSDGFLVFAGSRGPVAETPSLSPASGGCGRGWWRRASSCSKATCTASSRTRCSSRRPRPPWCFSAATPTDGWNGKMPAEPP